MKIAIGRPFKIPLGVNSVDDRIRILERQLQSQPIAPDRLKSRPVDEKRMRTVLDGKLTPEQRAALLKTSGISERMLGNICREFGITEKEYATRLKRAAEPAGEDRGDEERDLDDIARTGGLSRDELDEAESRTPKTSAHSISRVVSTGQLVPPGWDANPSKSISIMSQEQVSSHAVSVKSKTPYNQNPGIGVTFAANGLNGVYR